MFDGEAKTSCETEKLVIDEDGLGGRVLWVGKLLQCTLPMSTSAPSVLPSNTALSDDFLY